LFFLFFFVWRVSPETPSRCLADQGQQSLFLEQEKTPGHRNCAGVGSRERKGVKKKRQLAIDDDDDDDEGIEK
jgi:hypothetical protein